MKNLYKQFTILILFFIFLCFVPVTRVYANDDTKTVVNFDDGSVIVDIEKIVEIDSGVEVYLNITNDREDTIVFYKEPFYLLDNSKQDYSLISSEINQTSKIRSGAKNIVTLKFKNATLSNGPFELKGALITKNYWGDCTSSYEINFKHLH